MKKLDIKQESILLAMVAVPFAYVFYLWAQLPDSIPIHFDIDGTANNWGPKYTAFLLPGLSLFVYVITAAIPFLDPKRMSPEFMTGNFFKLRFILVFFMSALALVILHGIANAGNVMPYATRLIFLLLAGIGNFMINLKPNWFVGIRTPWTLSNDEVWRKTHQVAGRLFFFGALIGFLISFVLTPPVANMILIVFAILSSLFELAYSFWLFRRLQEASEKD